MDAVFLIGLAEFVEQCASWLEGIADKAKEDAAKKVHDRNQITRCLRLRPTRAINQEQSLRKSVRNFRAYAKLFKLVAAEGAK